jgi:hypothetical protein
MMEIHDLEGCGKTQPPHLGRQKGAIVSQSAGCGPAPEPRAIPGNCWTRRGKGRRLAGVHGIMKSFLLSLALVASGAAFAQPLFEPAGPSSRRTPVAISEIMFKPADRTDGRNTEFIELYNSNPWPEDVSGYRLAGQVDYVIPAATTIPSQGYLVVAANPTDLQAVYGLATVFGPYTNSLKTSGTAKLHDEQDSLLLAVDYDNSAPWPMGADGTGHSIVLARASYGEADPRAWERSELIVGSPGAAEVLQINALRNVVLNELLAHTDPPQVDSIELYNHGNSGVNLGGCTLSDDPATNKFTIPAGTIIPARGFVVFTETELGFALDAAGETIYFKNPAGTQVLDALRFEAQENGISFGRCPNGANDWYRLSALTFGTNNAAPLVSAVVFNEIMYHPLSGADDGQYVELYNRGTNAVNLAGWKLGGGIGHTFPTNCGLAAGGYLVVGRNVSSLLTNYPQLNATNACGNFSGKLSSSGERLTLTRPDTIVSTNNLGALITNRINIVVDEVTYGTGGRWGRWSDGGGSSLELRDARSDKRLAANWADSDETAKAPWTTVQTTGVLDNGSGSFSPVQLGLLDAGECLVDDVEVRNAGGVDCVGNGGFEYGLNSLAFIGNHSRTSLETNSGYAGSVALRVRTADSLATGPNAVQITLTNTSFSSGQSATLRFKARWLRGCPEPLLRFWGCYLEATARLTIPANLGTPGLPNSQAKTNNGPAIHQVRHDPAVPAANQPVVVTARVADPDGLASLTLQYRFDSSTTTTNLAMNDTGAGGDAVANDGVYSATLPGRPTGAIAFVLLATDSAGASSRFPELVADNAPVREGVVWFGEPDPTNRFGTYHLWLTQTNVNRWKALPIMSNEDIDGTLVYHGRVIYNMGGRYSGSPWHQNFDGPAGNRACHYVWSLPKDDRLLGYSSFNKIHWPGNDIQNDTITTMLNDPTLQREQAANRFLRALGVPWMNRRLVAVYVNGTRRGKLMEDACRPTGGGVKDQYFADDTDGQFYKLQRWYEGSGTTVISECRLRSYTTSGGAFKTARYRPIWALKNTPGSWSDLTNVFTLVTAANAYNQPNYENFIENVVDAENWMRVSAANHAAGNWDCFGATTGQNADAWVGTHHRWTLFTIDFGICLDNNLSGVGLFTMSDTAWARLFAKPKFGRMYYRALNELTGGIMQSSVIHPILDAKYAAFVAAGISATAPTATKSWIASQRSSIIAELASVNATPFALNASALLTSTNSVALSGTAPVEVVTLNINGVDYTPAWITLTDWSLTVPATTGTSTWTVEARDRHGHLVGGNLMVTVENTGVPASPVGNVIFNEIMFNPARAGAEYVELFNRTANTSFDLSGWKVNGLDYTFPPGAVLLPHKYLVLAKSRVEFAAAGGALIPVFDEFPGDLQMDGETLSLVQPGADAGPAPSGPIIITNAWPVPGGLVLAGRGGTPGAPYELLASTTLTTPASQWPAVATHHFDTNGDFILTNLFAGAAQFFRLRVAVGAQPDVVIDRVRYEPVAPWPTAPALTPGVALQLVDANQDNSRAANWAASTSLVTRKTPGAPNSVAGTLPEFPPLWLNEVQAENLTGPADNCGEREPWLELYNASTNPISLDGFYLGTNYSSPMQWAFPAGASIAPGQFLVVWLDGQPAQTSGAVLHTSFRLNPASGSIAVSRLVSGSPQVVDYLNYLPLPANYSHGDFPDGQPFFRESMYHPTPAGPNNALAAPITVSINEWMADNTGFLLNPATGKYDDWFELFNPAATPADLTGYYLTDDLDDPFQYQIPAGYVVATGGFLHVWADDKTSANRTNDPSLHVPFKLAKDGEALGLFAPDGAPIDVVVFGSQTANLSEGRYPDAGGLRLFMATPSPAAPNLLPPASGAPTITGFALQGDGTFQLEFPTGPGHTYRVEYKDNLGDPIWLPLGADHFATLPTLRITDSPAASQRFYRIRLMQ